MIRQTLDRILPAVLMTADATTDLIRQAFAAVDFFEARGLPYVVGINCFDGRLMHRPEDVREAMSIDPSIPMVSCDARDRESVKQALIALVEHAMRYRMAAGAV